MRIGQLRGLDNLLPRGGRFAVSDVLPDWSAEKQRFLQDEPKLPAQRLQFQVAHIFAVNADCSRRQLIKAWNQTNDGGFARASGSYKCGGLTGFDPEVDILQYQPFRRIAETYVFKFDSSLKFRRLSWLFACSALALHIHDFLDAFECNGRFRKIIGQPG